MYKYIIRFFNLDIFKTFIYICFYTAKNKLGQNSIICRESNNPIKHINNNNTRFEVNCIFLIKIEETD